MAIGLQEPPPLLKALLPGVVDRQLIKAIDEFSKVLTSLWTFHDELQTLSQAGVEGLIKSSLVNLLLAGLAELDIPLDKLVGAQGLMTEAIVGEVAYWSGITLRDTEPVNQVIEPDLASWQAEIEDYVRRLVRWIIDGKAVANGPSAVRHPERGADPVLFYRGEFERVLIDMHVNGAGYDFIFQRTYRSSTVYLGPLGPHWDHSYNLRLRQENEFVVARLTGQLSEQRFIRHPRFGDADFSYYVPPDGIYDVVIPDGNGSFLLRRPQEITYHYEATDQPNEHRIRRIDDRFGNYLDFSYSPEGRLHQVFVNSQYRHITFSYDEQEQGQLGRLERITDHTGRYVSYTYNDQGYLDCVAGPSIPGEKPVRLERYEYEQVGNLYKLVRVLDWKERIIVENEYEQNPLSDFLGYVVRQRENKGEAIFFYETLIGEADPGAPTREVPSLRVWEYRRNGHQIEHILNSSGNELLRRERIIEGGRVREAITRNRYNADGQVIASLDPEGVVTQFLFGREQIAETVKWPEIDPVLGDVRVNERMSFGNLLATVNRGQRVALGVDILDPNFWEESIARVKMRNHADDIVVKYRYTSDSQLLLSRSDPRHTISADPLHVESSNPGDPAYDPADPRYIIHQGHITSFEFGPGPRLELQRTSFPDRTRPSPLDGVTTVAGIVEEILRYDSNGRPLERIDARGYQWLSEYYQPSLDPTLRAKEGFLRRQLLPHVDWILRTDFPNILEIERKGDWQAFDRYLLSSGVSGDLIRITIEGERIALCQSSDTTERVSLNDQVEVRIDGNLLPIWNQAIDASYVINNLARGLHIIELQDVRGDPISIGRVRTHVSMEYEVDDLGHVLRETDALGRVTVNVIDALGRKVEIIKGPAANPTVVHYEYDLGDRLILERAEWRNEHAQVQPEIAVVKHYQYDQSGLLVSSSTGPEHGGGKRITRHHYDSNDNIRETINPRGISTYFEYDELDRQIMTIRSACSPDYSITRTSYDLASHILAQRSPRGALFFNGYRDTSNPLQSGIDTRGRVRVRTDPLGHRVVTDYNALDKPTVTRQFQLRTDGQLEMLSRRMMEYDEHGELIRVIEHIFESPILTTDSVRAPDEEFQAVLNTGQVQSALTEFHLDAHGNRIATRNPDGGIHRQSFDGRGRAYDQIDAGGTRSFRICDGNGNLIRIYAFEPMRDHATGSITHYDVFLHLYEYDELNREAVHIDPYGNRWQKRYDTLGNITSTIDPLGNIIRFRYNSFGEQITTIQERTETGLGGDAPLPPLITRREYDANGNTLAIIDPALTRTEFEYDAHDRLIRSQFAIAPNEPSELRAYDRAGNLISIIDRNGLVRRMEYDLLNRHLRTDIDITAVTPANALSPVSATFAEYIYDASGAMLQHENDYCMVEMRRDSRGLVLSERVVIRGIAGAPAELQIVRRFNPAGRCISLIYPSGRELSYTHDLLGRVTAIRNESSPLDYPGRATNANEMDLARYRYAGSRLISVVTGNGLTLNINFDGRGQPLERVVTRQEGSIVWRMQRLRDAAGFTRIETAMLRAGARSRRFAMDSIYRLTHYQDGAATWIDPLPLAPPQSPVDPLVSNGQALLNAAIGALEMPPGTPTYEYDEMGNRVTTSEPGIPPFDSAPNELNQYTAVVGIPWEYDANGNLRSDGERSFTYDLNNALQTISVINGGANEATLYRDALGRVVAEMSPAGTMFRINDGEMTLLEISPAGRVEYTPDHLAGMTIHVAQENEDYWLIRDGTGSLRLLTNSQGDVTSIPAYRPYGAPEDAELGLCPVRLGFGGMWRTLSLPLLHTGTRSYRHDLGRYLQRDPAGYIDNLNLYAYAGNNPVDRWDRAGLQGEPEEIPFLLVPPPPPLTLGDFQLRLNLDFLDEPPEAPRLLDQVWNHPAFDYARYQLSLANQYYWWDPRAALHTFTGHLYTIVGAVGFAGESLLAGLGWVNEQIDPHGDLSFALMMAALESPILGDEAAAYLLRGIQFGGRYYLHRWTSAFARSTIWRGLPPGPTVRGELAELSGTLHRYYDWTWLETIRKNHPAFDFTANRYGLFDFIPDEVWVNLKTIDLTGASYETRAKTLSQLKKHISKVADQAETLERSSLFGTRDIIEFQYIGQFPTLAQRQAYREAAQYALGLKIELRIRPYLRGL